MSQIKIYRKIMQLNEIDLFYLDTMIGATTIVCLHGRWGRAETWYDFMNRYGNQFRVIALEQRGHGLSGKPSGKYTPEEMAGDVKALLNHLGIDQAIVVGHSMGARNAAYFAKAYPESTLGLALLDKSASGPENRCALEIDQVQLIDPLTKDWPLPFSTRNEAMTFIKNFTDSELSYQYFMNSLIETVDGVSMMFSGEAMAANITYDEQWFDVLAQIKCPVMLLRSSSHEAVSDAVFEKMKEQLDKVSAFEVPHPDHNVHLGDKEMFYNYFDQFLSELSA